MPINYQNALKRLRNKAPTQNKATSQLLPRLSRGIKSYKKGGKIKKTGLAYLHEGERVLNVKQTKSFEKKVDKKSKPIGEGRAAEGGTKKKGMKLLPRITPKGDKNKFKETYKK